MTKLYNRSELIEAINDRNLSKAESLIKQRRGLNDKDTWEYSPFHMACNCHLFDLADLLLKFGADIETRNQFGDTPLFSAVEKGDYLAIDYLLTRGASPYSKSHNGIEAQKAPYVLGYSPTEGSKVHAYVQHKIVEIQTTKSLTQNNSQQAENFLNQQHRTLRTMVSDNAAPTGPPSRDNESERPEKFSTVSF